MDWGRGSKFKDGIRIAAGAYLIYLAVRIFREGILEGGMTGKSYAAGIIASLAFLIIGIWIIVFSLRSIAKATREEAKQEADAKEQPAVEKKSTERIETSAETPAEKNSIYARAMGSIRDSDDADPEENK